MVTDVLPQSPNEQSHSKHLPRASVRGSSLGMGRLTHLAEMNTVLCEDAQEWN